jgi:hypothetical protein
MLNMEEHAGRRFSKEITEDDFKEPAVFNQVDTVQW